VAVAALVLMLLWGPGDVATPDSATYIDGARHLARGEGWTTCRTELTSHRPGPIRAWPPGFSALMVPGIWLGLSPLHSARVVLTLSFVAAAVLVFVLARRVSGPRLAFLPFVAVGMFALQPSQLYVVNHVHSDVAFVPTVLLSVYFALRIAVRRAPGRPLQIALGAALAGMVLVRSAGLLMAAGILVGLFVSMRASSLAERARSLLPVVLTFGLLFAPWMVRNQLVGATPVGRVGLKLTNPLEHMGRAASGLVAWASDAAGALGSWHLLAGLYVWAATILVLVVVSMAVRHGLWRSRAVRLLGSVFVVYALLMIVTATLHPFNPLGDARFWAASWPLGGLVVLSLVRRMRLRLVWLHRAVAVAMALTSAIYLVSFLGELPRAGRESGLLRREVRVLAKLVPPKGQCRLLVNDARPLLVHRELGPTSRLPASREEFEAVLAAHPRLCVAVIGKAASAKAGVRPRRPGKKAFRGVSLVQSLVQSGRLKPMVERPNLRLYEAVAEPSAQRISARAAP
jgi:hypothetical protein